MTPVQLANARSRSSFFGESGRPQAGSCLVRPNGTIAEPNAALAAMLGTTHDVLNAADFARFILPADRPLFDSLRERLHRLALEFGVEHDSTADACELRLLTADGATRFARLIAILEPASKIAAAGAPLAAMEPWLRMMVAETTGPSASVTALRASHAQLREVQSIAQFGTFEWDADTDTVIWSDELFRIYGYEPGSFVPRFMSYVESIHADDRPRVLDRLTTAMVVDGEFDHEYRIVRPNGALRWLHARGQTIVDARGKVAGLRGSCQDVTERKELTAAHEETLRRLGHIATRVPGMMYEYRVDAAGRTSVPYSSDGIRALFGVDPADVVESAGPLFRSLHPEDYPGVIASLEASRRDASGWTHEFRTRLPDGTERWLSGTASAAREADGALVWYGYIADITEKRLAQLERERLEQMLRQAQKMRAIGQLAGGVAHDFNNVLAIIMGELDLTSLETGIGANVRASLDQIRASATRAATLCRQLLLFSRQQPMQKRAVDLNDTITTMCRLLERLLGTNVRIRLALAPEPVIAHVDGPMIEQVIMNLVLNARDAMPSGGEIVVSTARITPGGDAGTARITVRDTGRGIAAEQLQHIFEPFYSTKEVGTGTGLGLAIVDGIVSQHGGTVTVDSVPGTGTAFDVTLPLADGRPTAAPAARAAVPEFNGTEAILLAEDEDELRRVTRRLLERNGYTVFDASTVAGALALHAEHAGRIDLLMTDLVMTDGDTGQQLSAQLLTRQPSLKVLFTSGYSLEIAGKDLQLAPGQEFLQKPYSAAALLASIRRCLD